MKIEQQHFRVTAPLSYRIVGYAVLNLCCCFFTVYEHFRLVNKPKIQLPLHRGAEIRPQSAGCEFTQGSRDSSAAGGVRVLHRGAEKRSVRPRRTIG